VAVVVHSVEFHKLNLKWNEDTWVNRLLLDLEKRSNRLFCSNAFCKYLSSSMQEFGTAGIVTETATFVGGCLNFVNVYNQWIVQIKLSQSKFGEQLRRRLLGHHEDNITGTSRYAIRLSRVL
jgi:hypothetical protein